VVRERIRLLVERALGTEPEQMADECSCGMTPIYERDGRERGVVIYSLRLAGGRVIGGALTHTDYLGRIRIPRTVPRDFWPRDPELRLVLKIHDARWVELEIANYAGLVRSGRVVSAPAWAGT